MVLTKKLTKKVKNMLVRISKASELTGKSQQTLYRHIASGKLSATTKGTEKGKFIDTSELIRCYGELLTVEKNKNTIKKQKNIKETQENNNNSQVIELLKEQVSRMDKDLVALRAEMVEREKRAEDREKRLILLLESHEKKSFFGKLFT